MLLRKGLGLFFERAIPKSARRPPSADFSEKTRISLKRGILRIPKRSRKHPEGIGTKKRPNKESLETYKEVGMTGLEPATSRPPDACANQLRYIPNFL